MPGGKIRNSGLPQGVRRLAQNPLLQAVPCRTHTLLKIAVAERVARMNYEPMNGKPASLCCCKVSTANRPDKKELVEIVGQLVCVKGCLLVAVQLQAVSLDWLAVHGLLVDKKHLRPVHQTCGVVQPKVSP